MRLGMVIHRYGQGISGGAEVHCRMLALRLAGLVPDGQVEVMTTTARDYLSWANAHDEGVSSDGPVLVRRFEVAHQRNLLLFDLINRAVNLFPGRAPFWLEKLWLLAQGPNCTGLLEHLKEKAKAYDRLIFYTYLYLPTVLGLPLAASSLRASPWLIPTAHDEPPLRLKIMRPVFEQAQGLGYLSPAEADLVENRFNVAHVQSEVLGAGVEAPSGIDRRAFAAKHGLDNYILYLGRIDVAKGIPDLVRFWSQAAGRQSSLKLVLAGEQKMKLPPLEGVIRPGFVSEADKWSALAGAWAVVAPSPFESLNLTVLEAGAVGRPVLVNGRCPVLADYAARSGGGLTYSDAGSFGESLARLLDPEQARLLGQRNQNYVNLEFAWSVLDKKLRKWLNLE